jgi:hypothetical protein
MKKTIAILLAAGTLAAAPWSALAGGHGYYGGGHAYYSSGFPAGAFFAGLVGGAILGAIATSRPAVAYAPPPAAYTPPPAEQVWVPGHYEMRVERRWVPGHWDGPNVWVPGHYRDVQVRAWIPGYWEERG